MIRGIKTLVEYFMAVLRVFLVFTVALFLPWFFLYQVQVQVAQGKINVHLAHNQRHKEPHLKPKNIC